MSDDGPSSVHDRTLQLRDGRTLGFAEYGPPDGHPLVFCPGTPGSRYFRPFEETALSNYGVRLLVLDRPGYGRSTLDPALGLLDWPHDVVELLDSLDIDRTALAGHSGGGAFVLACAATIPERLRGVGLISAIAPFGLPRIRERMSDDEQHIGHLVETDPHALRDLAHGRRSVAPTTVPRPSFLVSSRGPRT